MKRSQETCLPKLGFLSSGVGKRNDGTWQMSSGLPMGACCICLAVRVVSAFSERERFFICHLKLKEDAGQMKLYTKTVCPKCLWVKSELQRSGKQADIVNLDHDEAARKRLMEAGLLGLPVLEVEGEFVTGPEEILKRVGCNPR